MRIDIVPKERHIRISEVPGNEDSTVTIPAEQWPAAPDGLTADPRRPFRHISFDGSVTQVERHSLVAGRSDTESLPGLACLKPYLDAREAEQDRRRAEIRRQAEEATAQAAASEARNAELAPSAGQAE